VRSRHRELPRRHEYAQDLLRCISVTADERQQTGLTGHPVWYGGLGSGERRASTGPYPVMALSLAVSVSPVGVAEPNFRDVGGQLRSVMTVLVSM
jgi:hypothetical protein